MDEFWYVEQSVEKAFLNLTTSDERVGILIGLAVFYSSVTFVLVSTWLCRRRSAAPRPQAPAAAPLTALAQAPEPAPLVVLEESDSDPETDSDDSDFVAEEISDNDGEE